MLLPTLCRIRTLLKTSISPFLMSCIARTQIGASSSHAMALPAIAVAAMLCRISVSSSATSIASSPKISCDFCSASLYPAMTVVGWMPRSSSPPAFLSSSPANITDAVVPSPTSFSCVFATATIVFALGCSTAILRKMVSPSLVIVTSPATSTSILSIPLGPNVDFTMFDTAIAAVIFICNASFPRTCSLLGSMTIIG